MHSIARLLALAIPLGAPLASAHGMIVAASGDAGGNGTDLGVSSPTSNDQQEVTQFNGNGSWNGWRMGGFLHCLSTTSH
jgi:hypothetical protein